MPRDMQDIVPKGSRSIRNVPLPEQKARKESAFAVKKLDEKVNKLEKKLEKEEMHLEKEESHLEKEQSHIENLRKARAEFEMHNLSGRRGGRKWGGKRLWTGAGAAGVVLLAILISTVFHGAEVRVSPKSLPVNVGGDYSAKKNPAQGELQFQPLIVKQTASETVKASGEEMVNKKATGVVVIYNNYNSASQRLIKNTRFETPSGLVYRISDSVTVPGKTSSGPGSVEVVVTAEESGEKYNAGLQDFTIPGFKGDPRYTAFYARSKTALAGGFSGTRKVVADADRKKAEESIRSKLRALLLEEVKKNVPDSQIFFDKAYSLDFVSLPEEISGSDVILKIEGTLSIALFNEQSFASYLASKAMKNYQKDAVSIKDPESIFFTPKSDFRPASNASIAFSLSGTPTFEWIYDGDLLKQVLAGTEREGVVAVLQKFPMIEKADISIRPFWRSSFPDSPERINIEKAE